MKITYLYKGLLLLFLSLLVLIGCGRIEPINTYGMKEIFVKENGQNRTYSTSGFCELVGQFEDVHLGNKVRKYQIQAFLNCYINEEKFKYTFSTYKIQKEFTLLDVKELLESGSLLVEFEFNPETLCRKYSDMTETCNENFSKKQGEQVNHEIYSGHLILKFRVPKALLNLPEGRQRKEKDRLKYVSLIFSNLSANIEEFKLVIRDSTDKNNINMIEYLYLDS